MARDRQRAKQRKARRAGQNPGPAPSQPHRSDVPGELDQCWRVGVGGVDDLCREVHEVDRMCPVIQPPQRFRLAKGLETHCRGSHKANDSVSLPTTPNPRPHAERGNQLVGRTS